MELRSIKELDEYQILERLLPAINNLYEKIDFIGITKYELYNLVLKEIAGSKNTYQEKINYEEYIKNRINILIYTEVKKKLFEVDTAINIINNYINKYFKKNCLYKDSISVFKKLDQLFIEYNYIPSYDVLIKIIEKNSDIYKMLESIIEKHYNQIISGNLEKIFDNNTIILMIETYCMLNNIEIKEEEFPKEDLKTLELTDSVEVYLQDINTRPLLSLEEEQKLARRIAQGDIYAKEIFIESNLKLVVSIAKRYIGQGLPLLDLIQEGNIGLIAAVDKYDVERGLKFSTYATYLIKQAITRAIANKGRNVRVPVHMYEKIIAYKKTITNLELILNRQPTINEIAATLGLSVSEAKKLYLLQSDTVSINSFVSNADEDNEYENFIASTDATPEDIVVEESLKYQVQKLFEECNLTPRETEVLLLRYGFNNQEPMLLEEIGKKFNISRERTRQIEASALMKIRNSKQIELLSIYMQSPEKSLESINSFREKYKETGSKNRIILQEELPKKKIENKKCQTIYQYFKYYPKELVDKALESLTKEERILISIKYGEDLNNPRLTNLSEEQISKFYGITVPKMRLLLSNLNKERKQNNC